MGKADCSPVCLTNEWKPQIPRWIRKGWGDGSVNKALSLIGGEPEFEPRRGGDVLVTPPLGCFRQANPTQASLLGEFQARERPCF